jgi:flagellar biosynthesis anti-sigma factor FlgM
VTPDRIDPVRPPYLRAIDPAGTPPPSRRSADDAAATRRARSSDSVELSPEARELGLRLVEATSEEERTALIERLRAEIASGDYRVDADALARALRDSGDLEQA